ncbi:MAG: carbon-nitrogen hydrolase family protein [Hyphomicrobiales bacterium]|nr:carbon-nitrogen hydrolase family protein [Hyphomicrobiales bacterium]
MSGDHYPKFKVAAIQAEPVPLDREATVDKACRLIEEAGRNGAKIIALPEGFIPGHPDWLYFYPPDEAMKRFYRDFFKNSVEVPSPATDQLGRAARRAGAYVAIGINERMAGHMGSLFNSILFLGPDGAILGVHRKLVPTTTERLVLSAGDGSTLNVYPTPYGEIGGLMCGENTNSLARFALLAQGEKIHTAHWPAYPSEYNRAGIEGQDIRIRYHAYEGKCFVISSASVFGDASIARLCVTEQARSLVLKGNAVSGIVNPFGKYVGGPLRGDEGIVYADVDMELMIDAKTLHDVTGHYNRFDVLSLRYHRKKPRSLEIVDEDAGDDAPTAQLRAATKALEAPDQPEASGQIAELRGLLTKGS